MGFILANFCECSLKMEHEVSVADNMKFCLFGGKFITEDRNLLGSLMSQNHSNPNLYKEAAEYIFHSKLDISTARLYFHNGITYHKNHRDLYIADFKMEIQMVKNTNGISLPIALMKYKTYTAHFKGDLRFHFDLLDQALCENSICELQYHLIRDMVLMYDQNILMWRKLAEINYLGFIYDHDLEKLEYDAHCKRKLMKSFNIFEVGLERIKNDEQHRTLHTYFADHIINIWKHIGVMNDPIENFLTAIMFRVFYRAHSIGALTDEYYVYWAEFSTKECDQIILTNAINKNKNNTTIWLVVLDHYLKLHLYEIANRVFRDGIRALENKSLPIWKMMMKFLLNKRYMDGKEMIVHFYKRAIGCPYEEIRSEFVVYYLKWSLTTHNKTMARKMFKQLKDYKPDNLPLYRMMISYEKANFHANNIYISEIYLDMCLKFSIPDSNEGYITLSNNEKTKGLEYKTNPVDLWIEALNFSYVNNNYLAADKMYKAATSVLSQDLMNDLEMKFEILKQNSSKEVKNGNNVQVQVLE